MPDSEPPRMGTRHFTIAQRMLGGSRWVIFAAVLGTFLSAMTLLLYSVGVVVKVTWDTVRDLHFDEKQAKSLSLSFTTWSISSCSAR